jgi:hypothetical protein
MKILHFTTNNARIPSHQAARPRGVAVEMINRLDRLFERIDDATGLIILDLQCAHWSADQFQQLRLAHPTSVPCIAYAQHVFPELLAHAKQVGIENVMTRGQFAASVSGMIERMTSVDA